MKISQLIIELGKAKEALGDIEVMMRISLTRLVVFDMLILRLLCFRLKIAEVSLS